MKRIMVKEEIKERQKRNARNKALRNKKRKQFFQLRESDKINTTIPDNVQDSIPVRRVAPNGIFEVGENLYSRSFLIEDLNYLTKTFEEKKLFFGAWTRLINSIDAHMFQITIFNKNRNMEEFRNKILYQHKDDNYNYQRDCYNDIMERKIIDGKNGIEQVKFFTFTICRTNYEDAKTTIKSIEGNLIREFSALGSVLVPLNASERMEFLYNYYRMGDEDKCNINFDDYIHTGRDWRNDICCTYLNYSEDPEYFRSEKKYGKALCVAPDSFPDDEITDDFLADIINVNQTSIFTISYVPISKSATKNILESLYMGTQDKIRKQQKKRNKNGDYTSEISYSVQKENEEIKDMMDQANDNGQKMFWVSIGGILLADSLEKLDDNVDSLSLIIENYSCEIDGYPYRQREAVNSILPLGIRQVDVMRNMFTDMAGILIPFRTMEMQQKKLPFYYGTNKESGELILCNRKNLISGNGFVFGTTGGGKSFTGAKLEQLSVFLNTDDDIIILDPTMEYRDIAESLGGTFINLSPKSPHHINPLHCNVREINSENIYSLIADKSQILCGIAEHAMEKEFKQYYMSIIDRCVIQLFTNILHQPVEERKVPLMQDFYEILKTQDGDYAKEILLSLEIFTHGSLNIFNKQTNIDPDNRLVVYGIRDIGQNLESVAMLVTLENIRMRIIKNASEGRATWLYVDEFHVLMSKVYSRSFLISLWKKVRKLGGLCTGITQNLQDVVWDDETKRLISNSEYTLFLRMGTGDEEVILDTFEGRITPEHLKYINHANPGEGLIRFGNTVIPMDNVISKSNPLYSVFNTNFYEKLEVKKSMEKAIK